MLEASLTLKEAIELGEFHPAILNEFPEFCRLSKHAQFQLIRKALDNYHKQLITQYAEVNNLLDSSKKPEVQKALDKIFNKIKKFEKEREKILLQFSQK